MAIYTDLRGDLLQPSLDILDNPCADFEVKFRPHATLEEITHEAISYLQEEDSRKALIFSGLNDLCSYLEPKQPHLFPTNIYPRAYTGSKLAEVIVHEISQLDNLVDMSTPHGSFFWGPLVGAKTSPQLPDARCPVTDHQANLEEAVTTAIELVEQLNLNRGLPTPPLEYPIHRLSHGRWTHNYDTLNNNIIPTPRLLHFWADIIDEFFGSV